MRKNTFINNSLYAGIEFLKFFNDPSYVKHIEIPNVEISGFTLPKFKDDCIFDGGPTAFREEYEKHVQKSLQGITNPCLYIFELVSPDVKTVFKTYKEFYNKNEQIKGIGRRSCSSIKNTYLIKENEHQILYVGKSEKPINGRIVVHFGYYEKGVAGLQLVYWGKDINLSVNVHVFEFINREMDPYLETLEKLFFAQLKPIIGKR
jgi:hypothetical protein